MSFSVEIKKELAEIKNKKACCRSSFAMGLLIDSKLSEDGHIELCVVGSEIFDIVSRSLHGISKTLVEVTHTVRLGTDSYTVRLKSEMISELIGKIERNGQTDELSVSIFKDESCKKSFLRGAFIALGTVNEPQKGYHLEFKIKNAARAAFIYRLLSDEGMEPRIVNRRVGSSVGLYYKNSASIEDLLTYIGAVRCIFDFINVKIEREIRNSVNRGTNCVAGNIAKSVNAAQKQVAAISLLEENGKLSMLPDELFETAKLRLENPSMSLSELALKHEPPISKSGLTHRLAKIIEISEELNINRKA